MEAIRKIFSFGRKKIKDQIGFRVSKTIMTVFMSLYCLTLMYPFFWLFLVSLTDVYEYLDVYGSFIYMPSELAFVNFKEAWHVLETGGNNFFIMFFNSIWWSFGGSILEIATAVCLGYAVAKYKFFGRKTIHAVSIFTMLLPIYGSMPANFVLLTELGLYNSPWILLTCCAGFGGTFIMTYAFFKGLPRSYMEAAFIDGAGHFRTFLVVMFPMAITPVAALFIQKLMGHWNDYMTPILYFPDYVTVPAGLFIFQETEMRGYEMPVLYSGFVLCMIPPLIMYIFLNNKLMSLTISGGLKG